MILYNILRVYQFDACLLLHEIRLKFCQNENCYRKFGRHSSHDSGNYRGGRTETRTLEVPRNCVLAYHRVACLRMRTFHLEAFFFNFQKEKKFVEETSNFSMAVGYRRKLRSPSKRRNPRGWQLAQRGINRPTPISVHPSTPSAHYGFSYSPTAISRHSSHVRAKR